MVNAHAKPSGSPKNCIRGKKRVKYSPPVRPVPSTSSCRLFKESPDGLRPVARRDAPDGRRELSGDLG